MLALVWQNKRKRRSPYGERGLKFNIGHVDVVVEHGRSPYGERGLKYTEIVGGLIHDQSRSPYGERGLKFDAFVVEVVVAVSLSLRRAWIEI